MFKIFDKNGDGFISCDEMQNLVVTFGEDLSDAEVNELIKEADTDKDGRVNLEEFKAAMNWNFPSDEFSDFYSYDGHGSVLDFQHYIHP